MSSSDPRREAAAQVGGRYDVRVLEPSPGAELEPPYFAEDPLAGGDLVPVDRAGASSWRDLCDKEGDDALARFCHERWLGPWPALKSLPDGFGSARSDLHAVAQYILAPLRHAANGKIGLRWSRGGFGTPFFTDAGRERQLRIAGPSLVLEASGEAKAQPLGTLAEVAAFAGVGPDARTGVFEPTQDWEPERPLRIEESAVDALGAFFGFCTSVLEQLRAEAPDATRVQLWPEHFDLAVDFGDEAAGRRANYGGSPGDDGHPEPYLYVGPWSPREGSFWNEPFGASLGYRALLEAGDAEGQRALALEFFGRARELLEGTEPSR